MTLLEYADLAGCHELEFRCRMAAEGLLSGNGEGYYAKLRGLVRQIRREREAA